MIVSSSFEACEKMDDPGRSIRVLIETELAVSERNR